MATSLLLRPLLRPQLFAGPIGVGLGIYTYHQLTNTSRSPLYKLDGGMLSNSSGSTIGNSAYNYTTKAKTPVVTKEGRLNPKAIRQVSLGSITGLCAGLLVSTFSKPLAIVLGLLVVGVQYASTSLGINLLPYGRLQKYVNGVDLRSAVQDNVALKVSFGVTFAMAGFMSF